jgi:hypothetical protein
MAKYYSPPKPGDIVQCRFPQDKIRKPGPKARPALIIEVEEYESPDEIFVTVAYGTSEDVNNCHPGEIKIQSSDANVGLSLDTKFDLGNRCKLPFDDEWFAQSPNKRFGEHPKRGALDTTDNGLKRRLSSAVAELKQAARPKPLDMTSRPSGRKKAER